MGERALPNGGRGGRDRNAPRGGHHGPARAALTFLLLLALAAPLAAADGFARLDFELTRRLAAQGQVLQGAGDVVSDWAKGKGSTEEALERLETAARAAAALEREVTEMKPGTPMLEAARAASSARTSLVQEARAFVRSGSPTRARLTEFAWGSSERTAGTLKLWLRARLAALESAAPDADYYRWQQQLLPVQLAQVEVSSQAQEILYRVSSGGSTTVRGPAAETVRKAGELRDRLMAVRPGEPVRAAHADAQAEAEGLVRVCEAVALLAEDPSEDAVSRVRRLMEELRRKSRQAEGSSLEALEDLLQK